MTINVENDWQPFLEKEFSKPKYADLKTFIANEYQNETIYPEQKRIFESFNLTPFSNVKVCLLGQDPYHEKHQAHGLSFSVLPGEKIPPSLRNMYQELETDLGIKPVNHGYLKAWAEQGVLMLNSVLTVREGAANSHRNHGWEMLTDAVIEQLSAADQPVIFVLWGKTAQNKIKLIDTERNFVIISPHPSPLSAYRGFFGSKPFSKINQKLISWGLEPINWQLPNI
ncbi:uracil-DNA glycosylase [Dellaglioa sp. BT-FLS60]